MNHIAPRAEPLIREIPLIRLALAPENVRKTPADPVAEAEMKASIAAHGLLENLVARLDGPADAGTYAVVAGGRRLAAMKALAEDGVLDADHPVPCLIAADPAIAGELSLAENVVRIAMHPADQVVAFTTLALMLWIDELFLKYPFYGARRTVPHLRRAGVAIGHGRNTSCAPTSPTSRCSAASSIWWRSWTERAASLVYAHASLQGLVSMELRLNEEVEGIASVPAWIGAEPACLPRAAWMK